MTGLFGGSEELAELHLRRALNYNPQSTATLYFLSEVLLERGKKAEALATFQQVLDSPLDPDWAPEDKSFKTDAAKRLKELQKKYAERVVKWDFDNNVSRRMAYNHYFGQKAAAPKKA